MSRKRALTDEQVLEIRHAVRENARQWREYRLHQGSHFYDDPEPHHLSMTDLAARFKVSPGTIQNAFWGRGAYSQKPRITLLPDLKWRTDA